MRARKWRKRSPGDKKQHITQNARGILAALAQTRDGLSYGAGPACHQHPHVVDERLCETNLAARYAHGEPDRVRATRTADDRLIETSGIRRRVVGTHEYIAAKALIGG